MSVEDGLGTGLALGIGLAAGVKIVDRVDRSLSSKKRHSVKRRTSKRRTRNEHSSFYNSMP